ncbi:hypothetical protein PLESTM_001947300 [Pleodorina starrii]|nr:hypothetical protein PLESTM_001947300 [Pleodorina starrii]
MSSKNPSRDASAEPPDTNTIFNADVGVAERGALPRSRKGAANEGLCPSKTHELVKRFKALKKECLVRQREKAQSILAKNKAAFEAYLPRHVQAAEARARTSLPIPRIGDVQTGLPGSQGPAPAALLPPPSLLPLPLSDRRVTIKSVGSGSGSGQQAMRSFTRPIPAIQPPPSYTTWSYLKRNELARDHGRRMFLVDEVGETVPADDGEKEERLPWEGVDGAAVDWAMSRLAEEVGWDDPDVLEALMDTLRPQPQPEAIAQRLSYLQSVRQVHTEPRDMEVEEVVDVFAGSFCRRCRVYACRTHGGGHVKPHHRPAPPPPDMSGEPCGPECWRRNATAAAASGAAGGGARPTAAAAGAAGDDAPAASGTAGPASEQGSGAAGDNRSQPVWSRDELSRVKKGLQVFGPGNPCMVARLLYGRRTCAQVKEVLERVSREQRTARGAAAAAATAAAAPSAAAGAAGSGEGGSAQGDDVGTHGDVGGAGDAAFLQGLSRVPARRKGGRAKKAVLSNKSSRSLVVLARAQHGNNGWHEYQPCTCMGKCKADCPCVRAHNFCEKFCACSPACKERFRGCTCKSGCKNNQCPCWAAGRECDPDLCGGCAPTLEAGSAEPGRECHNMRLRLRQHARVVLGTSDIPGAGWGLFAAQYVPKNGFLGEYTGDLITQDEANRRGSVYDHMNNSYLFNLNNEWVVDAKFRGNKLRCANHSHEPVAKAKVLLVDGESRIAILADKTVTPGMEITYDYKYSDDTAPQWVKKKQQRG